MRGIVVLFLLTLSFAGLLFQALYSRMQLPNPAVDQVEFRTSPPRVRILKNPAGIHREFYPIGYSKYV